MNMKNFFLSILTVALFLFSALCFFIWIFA
jgi:hypothetical protein